MSRRLLTLGSFLVATIGATAVGAQQGVVRLHAASNLELETKCAETFILISGEAADDGDLACLAVRQALQLLGRCGITPRRPLRLEITDQIRHPFGRPVLGFFDVADEKVFVRTSKAATSLVRDTPFGALPPSELYRSVVAHEIVHGVLHQNSLRHTMSHTAGEYLAYAFQIASLDPGSRAQFLQSLPNRLTPDNFLFTDILLSLDPFLFAAHAYEHFEASHDSCGQLITMLEGEVPFISDPLY